MSLTERSAFRDQLTDAQAEALTAYGEARGESVMGLIAVICVIRNRVKAKPTSSRRAEALRTAAFSCWLDSDPNASTLSGYAHLLIGKDALPYNPVLDVCMTLADRADLQDPTGGATHYFNPTSVAAPTWTAPPARHTVTIGHHTFWTHVAF